MEVRETGRTPGLDWAAREEVLVSVVIVGTRALLQKRWTYVQTDGTLKLQCRKPRTMYLLPKYM
jgi:hypothetical protein